jgi:hypothetical protein
MQMCRFRSVSFLSLSAVLVTACQTPLAAKNPTGVEVFIKGSDIETPENVATRSLRDALESEISARQDLHLALAGRGDLSVLIPDFVSIDRSSPPERLSFTAHLKRAGNIEAQIVSGSCPRTNLSACTQTIMDALSRLSRSNEF